jgi:hypothetical protein
MPDLPAHNESHDAPKVLPRGVTDPMPVITTLFTAGYDSTCMQKGIQP